MTEEGASRPGLGESHEADREAYRAVSGLAVTTLVLGVVSAVALVDPVVALVSAATVVVGCVALWRIARRSPELVGRAAALVGIALALLFGTISLGQWTAYRWLLTREASKVSAAWFEFMARGQPQLAHQLALQPDDRQPPESDAWAAYRGNRQLHEALEEYLSEKLPRTLLALGTKATVRLCATETIEGDRPGKESVVQLYAVTFDLDKKRTTFLARVLLYRTPTKFADRAPWRVAGVNGGVRPLGDEETAEP